MFDTALLCHRAKGTWVAQTRNAGRPGTARDKTRTLQTTKLIFISEPEYYDCDTTFISTPVLQQRCNSLQASPLNGHWQNDYEAS